MGLYVFPGLSFDYIRDRFSCGSIFFCKISIFSSFSRRFLSNFKNVALGKIRGMVKTPGLAAAFSYFIVGVVFMGSYEKMVRVYAICDIAFMQHAHSFRNFTKMNFPRNPMRICSNPISINIELPVTIFKTISPPKPTRFSLTHFTKESFYHIQDLPQPESYV